MASLKWKILGRMNTAALIVVPPIRDIIKSKLQVTRGATRGKIGTIEQARKRKQFFCFSAKLFLRIVESRMKVKPTILWSMIKDCQFLPWNCLTYCHGENNKTKPYCEPLPVK